MFTTSSWIVPDPAPYHFAAFRMISTSESVSSRRIAPPPPILLKAQNDRRMKKSTFISRAFSRGANRSSRSDVIKFISVEMLRLIEEIEGLGNMSLAEKCQSLVTVEVSPYETRSHFGKGEGGRIRSRELRYEKYFCDDFSSAYRVRSLRHSVSVICFVRRSFCFHGI